MIPQTDHRGRPTVRPHRQVSVGPLRQTVSDHRDRPTVRPQTDRRKDGTDKPSVRPARQTISEAAETVS